MGIFFFKLFKKERQQQTHICASPSACSHACLPANSLFIRPPGRRRRSHTCGPPLRVQGCCAITKTALSITLTDRLKRGFNSYSSPRALHHRGRHPSTPRLPLSLAFYRRLLSITRGGPGKNGPRCSRGYPHLPTHPPPLSGRCQFREVQQRQEKEPCPD